MTNHLFVFTIGPVQSFIAAARRTQDLRAGSRILSQIAASGVDEAIANGARLLFPSVQPGEQLSENSEGTPHRFAFISEEDPQLLAQRITARMRYEWTDNIAFKAGNELYEAVRDAIGFSDETNPVQGWEDTFQQQVADWLEIYWVAVDYDLGNHGQAYSLASRALAMRKAARHVPVVAEPGRKCTLSGAQAALPLNWGQLSAHYRSQFIRSNEALGAVATVKRFWGKQDEHIPSTREIAGNLASETEDEPAQFPYLAVLHMDGDSMGKRISEQTNADGHAQLSENLKAFSESVSSIASAYENAVLIYAGGDDVLALLPLSAALACANDMRNSFERIVGGTISAGIAIMGVKTPLDLALEEARLAEEHAKELFGRNAIVVRDVRSNAIRECGGKWTLSGNAAVSVNDVELINVIAALQEAFTNNQLGGKLGYDMHEIARYLTGVGCPPAMRQAEFGRLFKRRLSEGLTKTQKSTLESALVAPMVTIGEALGEEKPQLGWEMLANWTILARFLANGGGRQ